MNDWQDVASAPMGIPIRTKLAGERGGENVCIARRWPDGTVEWIECATGATTVTHNYFLPPSHWQPLTAPSNKHYPEC